MRRAELEHVIRAAAEVAGDDELVIVGSQAILGQFPDVPQEMLVSREADIYPKNHPERADRSTAAWAMAPTSTPRSVTTPTGSARRPPRLRPAGWTASCGCRAKTPGTQSVGAWRSTTWSCPSAQRDAIAIGDLPGKHCGTVWLAPGCYRAERPTSRCPLGTSKGSSRCSRRSSSLLVAEAIAASLSHRHVFL